MNIFASITCQNSPFLMGGGNYSEELIVNSEEFCGGSEEAIGNSEEVFCGRHKVGLTHFVLISFLENVFHKLVRWLSGMRSTGGFLLFKGTPLFFLRQECQRGNNRRGKKGKWI